jgi:hypothetical protein
MAQKPHAEFGKRRPVAVQTAYTAQPVKRSGHVALLLMGTFAIGGGAYALMPGGNCQPGTASNLQAGAECPPRGTSSGGGYGSSGVSSRNSFYGGDASSSRSPAGTSSDSGSGGVTRGGFGSFARAFTAHFSGGG